MKKQKYWIEDYPTKCKDGFHELLLNEVGFETYLYYKLYNIEQENLNSDCVHSFIAFFNQFLEAARSSNTIDALLTNLYNDAESTKDRWARYYGGTMGMPSIRPTYETNYCWGFKND